ncbi:MAG: tRNA uridine-5-carboxymethylaminomethyl(34) synthesis GTPase MnmE, partial [Atribacterota bacterium]|nr:tRNA uridine-5-carboxymethylaminomethyl(34) synthesis GTPase MnmE [Atribacterota bacterium]
MTDVFSNNQTSEEDTIAAISTPLGLGGIGIVRISGPLSISIASKIFRYKRKNVIEPEKYISHKFYYGIIVVPEKEIVLDEVMMVVMRAPKTYTREDMVEINCHGGLFVLKKVLELIIGLGARLAEPGEFTKNAFLNGRVDLSQAEAVIDIINANCEQNLKSSLYQLSGGLKTKIRKLIENTIELNIKIEAPMDFPDQGIEIIEKKQIKISLQKILTKINELLDTVKYGQIIKEGINCLILGK